GQEEQLLDHGMVPCLYDLAAVRRLAAAAEKRQQVCPFHLKIDTGMGRVGVLSDELPEVLTELTGLKHLRLEGVISHLAVADDPEHPFTGEQIERFRQGVDRVRRAGFSPKYVHISNSAALFSRDLPECNLVRPGIVLYGALPSESFRDRLDLRPVMSFRSAVAQVKVVPPGAGISYGHRFVAERRSVIAAVPVGYADGYNRLLSCCGEVLVRGQRAPVAGTVCMDWILIDVTDIPGVAAGDEVTLLGRDNGNVITAEEWAGKIGTIPYEVFCRVSRRVPRVTRSDE
ncbi:MAG: alanine racemase, partial [Desulfuromonadales bacterium]|nr:alanine racemase [Desulfuromonadales bacterium]NIS40365.1 alanine racemase [Desulfuromonadales bacterium]